MISRASAIRYDREASNGRNLPLLVSVETEQGEEHEVFLKLTGRPELSVTSLAVEVLSSCLAGHLGLPICRPFLVQLSPDWIGSIPDAGVRGVLENSNPVAFGSEDAGMRTVRDRIAISRFPSISPLAPTSAKRPHGGQGIFSR